MLQTHEVEHLVEGGATMLNRAINTTPPSADTVASLATTRQCRKKKSESAFTSWQLVNYASNSDYDDHGRMFIMRHKANSMTASNPTNTSNSEDVWFVDSGASNHMTSHEDWFWELRKPEQPDYVETRMTQFTPFSMSVMSHSGKKVTKPTSRTSCMSWQ